MSYGTDIKLLVLDGGWAVVGDVKVRRLFDTGALRSLSVKNARVIGLDPRDGLDEAMIPIIASSPGLCLPKAMKCEHDVWIPASSIIFAVNCKDDSEGAE